MEGQNEREVLYSQYCKTCRHVNVPETEDPCNECLTYPSNIDSHKPINYEKGAANNG